VAVTASRPSTTTRLAGIAIGIALCAVALLCLYPAPVVPGSSATAATWFAALLVAFCVVEVVPLHLEWSGQAYSLSLSEVPLVVGLLCFASPLLVLARVLGSGLALALHRRQPPIKLAFNLSAQAFEAGLALVLFTHLPRHGAADVMTAAGPVAFAVIAGSGLSMAAVCLAIRLTVGHLDRSVVRAFAVTGGLAIAVNGSMGLVVVSALRDHRLLAVPLAIVLFTGGVMYRAYAGLRQRHADLETLYDFTRGLGHATGTDTSIGAILQRTQKMLRAERAGLLLVPAEDSEHPTLRWTDGDGGLETEKYVAGSADWPFARTLSRGVGLVIPRNAKDLGLVSFLQERGLRDAVLAPLRLDGEMRGVLIVADRAGDLATFTEDDRRMFETVATQVSTVLENSRLLDQLTWDSMHDALTGLANRQCYQTRLRTLLATTHTPFAVLLTDLDRFKEVNDTLGHHHGDLLIREIAQRISDAAPANATVARLGGDEFALLVPGADVEEGMAVGQRIRAAVGRPCVVDGVTVDVDASVGVAVAPLHGRDDSALLKRADMAMYAAKSTAAGVELYDSERDEYSPRRLALASQIRQAIARDELMLHYQPQVCTATGRVTGVEALVRWRHPVYGTVMPAEFVPLAERSGVIADLTLWVLRTSLAQAARWRDEGLAMRISVNVSMRNLLDTTVADTLAALLRLHRLPPGSLTLEITESHIMTDAARTLPVLYRLSAIGARLSVDDFGTGYSSLAYLQQLPVDEVKIDKSFVLTMSERPGDAAIVRAIVGLAASLDMDTVAEGVEDATAAAALERMGCTRLQGYHVSPPMAAGAVAGWIRGHGGIDAVSPVTRREPVVLAG
jgi:diguanylate cyclase (GGDEF)-like protein